MLTSLQRSALLYSQFFTYLPTSNVVADDFKAQYIHPHSPLSRVMFDVYKLHLFHVRTGVS